MIPNIHEELEKVARAEDDIEATKIGNVLIEKLEQEPDAFSAVPLILDLMERHPAVDFGVPGPLVHFVERFYGKGYEGLLCESFARRPTMHTALMMHRLINGSSGELKQKYLGLLEAASRRPDIDQNSRNEALQNYKFHTEEK